MLHSEPSCDGGVACGSAAGEGWCRRLRGSAREAGRATESTQLVVLSLFAERGESAGGKLLQSPIHWDAQLCASQVVPVHMTVVCTDLFPGLGRPQS